MKNEFFNKTKGGLIVSCQALPEEPLNSPYIMSRMAVAASLGGASGIRSNSVEDIREIKKVVNLPIIGLMKRKYGENPVFITPTEQEVELLAEEGVDVIAMDATMRIRPNGEVITQSFPKIRKKYPHQLFMADCSTYEEGRVAQELGFDIVGTTLCGYTEETANTVLPDYELLEKLTSELSVPCIAEGGIWGLETIRRVHKTPNLHAIVVGSAITRPMEITRYYLSAISE